MFKRSCCGHSHSGPVCPDGFVMCCLCFERFEKKDLHQLEDDSYEDVCKPCAEKEQECVKRQLIGKCDHE